MCVHGWMDVCLMMYICMYVVCVYVCVCVCMYGVRTRVRVRVCVCCVRVWAEINVRILWFALYQCSDALGYARCTVSCALDCALYCVLCTVLCAVCCVLCTVRALCTVCIVWGLLPQFAVSCSSMQSLKRSRNFVCWAVHVYCVLSFCVL